jgi:hypothetical protein
LEFKSTVEQNQVLAVGTKSSSRNEIKDMINRRNLLELDQGLDWQTRTLK